MVIRVAQRKDVDTMRNIYNEAIVGSVATFDLEVKSTQDRVAWFEGHTKAYPLIVALVEDKIAGYACLSSYRPKEAYKSTAEVSIYVAVAHQGIGVGYKLMEAILNKAKEDPQLHTVVSVITAGNAVSRRLHEKFGFTYCGRIKEVGEKFGQMLDIDNYQLMV